MRGIVTDYTFVAATKTITLPSLPAGDVEPELLLGIWNVTSGTKIYDPHVPSFGAAFAGTSFVLAFDTTSMADGDTLLIFYESDWTTVVEALLSAINTAVQGAARENGGHLEFHSNRLLAIETILTTMQGLATTLNAKDFATQSTLSDILAKIIAAPATEAKQDAMISALATLATEATLASILAGLPANMTVAHFRARTSGTGYGAGDHLLQFFTLNPAGSVTSSFWFNSSTDLAIAAPPSGDVYSVEQNSLSTIATAITTLTALFPAALTGSGNLKVAIQEALPAGSAVIGSVAIDQTTPGTTNAVQITGSIPSGTNTIGKSYGDFRTTKALTNASINESASGDRTIVSGTASQTIRVFRLSLTVSGATTLTIKDAAGGNTLAIYDFPGAGSMTLEDSQGEPYFVTATAGAFVINSSATINMKGNVQYTKS